MNSRFVSIGILGFFAVTCGCQCGDRTPVAEPGLATSSETPAEIGPPTCEVRIELTSNKEWKVTAKGPHDRDQESAASVLRNKIGPAGGFERKVDPKYRWDLSVIAISPNELILQIDFDSLDSKTELSIAGEKAEIVRAMEGDRKLAQPVRLSAGKHTVIVTVR